MVRPHRARPGLGAGGGVGRTCRPPCRRAQYSVLLGLRIRQLTPKTLEPTCVPWPFLLPPGVYVCAKCGYELFSSRSKYAHSSPWPAFTETIHADSVAKRPERNSPDALKVRAAVGRSWGSGPGRA